MACSLTGSTMLRQRGIYLSCQYSWRHKMRIPLDRQSEIPLYQQIKSHLRQGILAGSLAADTRLPASRQLAQDLGVNRITIENAYAELEAEGLVISKLGSGTYVLHQDSLLPLPKNNPDAAWPFWQKNLLAHENNSRVHRDIEFASKRH